MPELDDHAETRLAIAALFAALVRAIERGEEIARSDFTDELEKVIRGIPASANGTLDTLRGTSELLKH